MIINKSSWHYKLYELSYGHTNFGPPLETNLCQYMRRLIIAPPIMLVFAIMIVAVLLSTLLLTPIAMVLSVLFSGVFVNCLSGQVTPFNGLRLGRWELYPWHLAGPLTLFTLSHLANRNHHPTASLVLFGLMLLAIVFAVFMAHRKHAEPLENENVLMAYLRAKKEKVCPRVEFVKKEEGE